MNIVSIMNFVRGCEPRDPSKDLIRPVREQIALAKRYDLKNTFLLQYDAIIKPEFSQLFIENADDNTELGIWIEIVRPLVEKVGIEWRGRPGYDWDWYVNPGLLMAYTRSEKEALIDEIMSKFSEVFGFLPKSVGSWLLDAYSVEYMQKKYGIQAFGICREQLAVDAYTLWGGPYNQPYYPSRTNILCPSQSAQTRIDAPVFRLLGIDPIRGYNEERYSAGDIYTGGCGTIEPVWSLGQSKVAMEWFFKTYFENENMGIAYAQVGQENSFGWESMAEGLELQYAMVKEYADAGKFSVVKMCEAGEMFKAAFSDTPAAAIVADSDPVSNERYRTVWFTNKNYRANLLLDNGAMYFRDMQKFDDKYSERYTDEPCLTWDAVYDALPLVNERVWSEKNMHDAGIDFNGEYSVSGVTRDGGTLTVAVKDKSGKDAKIVFGERTVELIALDGKWTFGSFKDVSLCGSTLKFKHNGFEYSVKLVGDVGLNDENVLTFGKGGLRIEF